MTLPNRYTPEAYNGECPESCGHEGAQPHTYALAWGQQVAFATCEDCHQRMTQQLAAIAKVAPRWQRHAHAVLARAMEIGLSHRTQMRVLSALAALSHEFDFVLRWPEWCWDNYAVGTVSALAFPTDNIPEFVSEPGRGGRRVRKHARREIAVALQTERNPTK
jgi:hypothetical protein